MASKRFARSSASLKDSTNQTVIDRRAVPCIRYEVEPLERRLLLNGITTLGSFNTSDYRPGTSLILSGDTLYDTTSEGGSDNDGTVFSLPVTGGTPTAIGSFNGIQGSDPQAGVIQSGDTLYGTTAGGGAVGDGSVFSLPITGGTPTELTWFVGTDGGDPQGGLILSGTTLYGTTYSGGTDADGTVFSLPVSGGTPTVLASFDGTDGISPYASLVLSGSTLYGTTTGGGADSDGTVFSLPVSGGVPRVLCSFDGTNGSMPSDSLVLSGNTLYGTTYEGGADNFGAVFALPVTGGTPTVLASFNRTDGAYPFATLVLSGSTLYGTTDQGGTDNVGVIFSLSTSGGTPTVIVPFNSTNGASPQDGLLLSGTTLYGTAPVGGGNGAGNIFELSIASANPQTITINNGSVLITGTNGSDTIAGGVDPADSSDDYFLIQTYGQPTVEQYYPISAVTGLTIDCDPIGSTPPGADDDLVNLGGDNFGFAETVNGGNGSDTIIGQQGPNQINTGIGSNHNIVYGSIGNDTLTSYGSDDTLRSGGGTDTIQAGSGNNVLVGGKDGSDLIAGIGWDTLRAGRGNSTLIGGQGASAGTLMLGGFGNDYLDGVGSSNDTMIAGSGLETLLAGTGIYFMDAGWDSYLILSGGGTLPASMGTDSVIGTNTYRDTIVSSGGTPQLLGGGDPTLWDVNNTGATLQNFGIGDFLAENDTVNLNAPTTTLTVHLTIVDQNGTTSTDVAIPDGAGDSPNGTSAVRTTDANGTIVFQTNATRTFTLADFFNHWGVAFDSTGVGQFVASPGSGHTLSMTVNGVNNTQFGAYPVQNGDNIVITFTQ